VRADLYHFSPTGTNYQMGGRSYGATSRSFQKICSHFWSGSVELEGLKCARVWGEREARKRSTDGQR